MEPQKSNSKFSLDPNKGVPFLRVVDGSSHHPSKIRRWIIFILILSVGMSLGYYAYHHWFQRVIPPTVATLEPPIEPSKPSPSPLSLAPTNVVSSNLVVEVSANIVTNQNFGINLNDSFAEESHPIAIPAVPLDQLPSQPELDDSAVKVVRMGPSDRKQIALTFDDGPHPVVTPQVLDLLRDEQVKATFFVLGAQVKKHPEILRRILSEGHEVGNHTYSHQLLSKVSEELARQEIVDTQQLIRDAAQVETHLFRPPFGAYRKTTKTILKEMGLNIVLWSVDPADWRIRDSETIAKKVLNHAQNGSIIVCHDIYKSTLKALPAIIHDLKEKEYEFVTVNQLCTLPVSSALHTPKEVESKPPEQMIEQKK